MFCFSLCVRGILDLRAFQGLWELGAWLSFWNQGRFQTVLQLTVVSVGVERLSSVKGLGWTLLGLWQGGGCGGEADRGRK